MNWYPVRLWNSIQYTMFWSNLSWMNELKKNMPWNSQPNFTFPRNQLSSTMIHFGPLMKISFMNYSNMRNVTHYTFTLHITQISHSTNTRFRQMTPSSGTHKNYIVCFLKIVITFLCMCNCFEYMVRSSKTTIIIFAWAMTVNDDVLNEWNE